MKTLIIIALLLAASAPTLHGEDSTTKFDSYKTSYTKYDPYIESIQKVLSGLKGSQASIEKVEQLMKEGNAFEYEHTIPYSAMYPTFTESRKKGDCKDKSLWLAYKMRDPNIRFVIGKLRKGDERSHAWLVWRCKGKRWILDCTAGTTPLALNDVPEDRYIPYYSYMGKEKFLHKSTRMDSVAFKAQ